MKVANNQELKLTADRVRNRVKLSKTAERKWKERTVTVTVDARKKGRLGAPLIVGRAWKLLAIAPDYKGRPYSRARLVAEVVAVHAFDCPMCKGGKRHGPCDCGAHEMFELWKKGEL